MIQLRDANVPVRIIAENLKIGEDTVRKIIANYYKRNADWASISTLARKHEIERQLGMLDQQLMRIVAVDPLSQVALQAVGLTYRDWLSTLDLTRRIKGDIVRLHGLEGPTGAAESARDQMAADSDPDAAARHVKQFIERLHQDDPQAAISLVSALRKRAARDHELPLSGGGRSQADGPPVPPEGAGNGA